MRNAKVNVYLWRYFNIAEFLCVLKKKNCYTYTSGQLHNNINDGPLNK